MAVSVPATAQRLAEEPQSSRVSYSSDYMVNKPADTPSLPWYGFSDDADARERYGVWSEGSSRLISHEGYLFTFQGSDCLLRMLYMRPGSTQWRVNSFHPYSSMLHERETRPKIVCQNGCSVLWQWDILHAPGILYSKWESTRS